MYHNFERNEIIATGFLKWTDFTLFIRLWLGPDSASTTGKYEWIYDDIRWWQVVILFFVFPTTALDISFQKMNLNPLCQSWPHRRGQRRKEVYLTKANGGNFWEEMSNMAVRIVEFSNGGRKLKRFLPKNQHTQRKLILRIGLMGRCQKLGIVLENKVI